MNKFRLVITVLALSLVANLVTPFTVSAALSADTIAPSDVTSVKALAAETGVTLTWDASTDDTAVAGYKIYYGTQHVGNDGLSSYTENVDVKNVTTFTVEQLTSGTTYYFVVTAYDDAGNESEFYSAEVNATPKALVAGDTTDLTAPTVSKATALNQETVKVTFSEAVKLPSKNAQEAFSIQNNKTLEILEVIAAAVDTSDLAGKTVLLTTQKQTSGVEYILTAGVDVEDVSANPIVSGTSDIALFTGSSVEKVDMPVLSAAPEETGSVGASFIKEVTTPSSTTVEITFTAPVKLSIDPSENFVLTVTGKDDESLPIFAIDVNDAGDVVTLTTPPQMSVSYTLKLAGVKTMDDKDLDLEANTKDFMGKGETLADLIPPEDVTGLLAKILKTPGDVRLHWKPSLNSAGDLLEQLLYRSDDGGKTYGTSKSLSKTADNTDVKGLKAGMEYFFKITSKDTSGNESQGTVVAVKLPETGMGLGLLGLVSLGAGSLFGKRRKK